MDSKQLMHLKETFQVVHIDMVDDHMIVINTATSDLPALCQWLFKEAKYHVAGIVAEERESSWELRYLLYDVAEHDVVQICEEHELNDTSFPSVSPLVHAFDWHEREVEDVFELSFEGHPRLGDFVLHDEMWNEGLAPMRKQFDNVAALEEQPDRTEWKPRRVVHAPGAFVMSVGPIFSGTASPVNYLIESVGEEVIRAYPRLFYAYRGIEKVFEGRSLDDGLLLAERFAQSTALAHGIGYCRAIEQILKLHIPPRANILRGFLAELERIRHHAGVLVEIIESTALAIPASEVAICEEQLLRLTSFLTNHRYGVGILAIGGLNHDITQEALQSSAEQISTIAMSLERLSAALSHSSSFLDRLEDVGQLTEHDARTYGLVGPVARASGLPIDLRIGLPYGPYSDVPVPLVSTPEGDNYARVRMLFEDIRISNELCSRFAQSLGVNREICAELPTVIPEGWGFGWVEAPQGANFIFLRTDANGRIQRTHIMPPSFANWHGLHKATEGFAFQDFPIIVSTLGLSVAENDR